jgi:hypothetical protein
MASVASMISGPMPSPFATVMVFISTKYSGEITRGAGLEIIEIPYSCYTRRNGLRV